MRIAKKAAILALLGLLEVVFLSWILASNLPRRSADVEAFTRYNNAPTPENRDLWLKERQITQNEVTRRRYAGAAFGFGNLLLIGWVASWKRRSQAEVSATVPGVAP
jgi:hypothetical protein